MRAQTPEHIHNMHALHTHTQAWTRAHTERAGEIWQRKQRFPGHADVHSVRDRGRRTCSHTNRDEGREGEERKEGTEEGREGREERRGGGGEKKETREEREETRARERIRTEKDGIFDKNKVLFKREQW